MNNKKISSKQTKTVKEGFIVRLLHLMSFISPIISLSKITAN